VVEKTMNGALASIIIISYNGLYETTAPCLQSIFEQTDYPDFEVIVVDNNSTDGTQDYLAALAANEPRLMCIFNTTNRGFAGGNNDAIKVAKGNFLILLNSDTRVTKGWLERIVGVLVTDPSIGLVGPVSNATGNEQTIYVAGTTPEEILDEGTAWVKMSYGTTVPMERLCFFCVAMRRDVIEKVGLLDETYGLGFYEDDDYCLRVKKAGFRLVCCEDVFIYHRGSASFGNVPCKTKELLKKNRCLLEKKFNIRYNPPHPRDRQLALVASYVQSLGSSKDEATLRFRINNRLQVINELMPRGFFKRWRFRRRIDTVMAKLTAPPKGE